MPSHAYEKIKRSSIDRRVRKEKKIYGVFYLVLHISVFMYCSKNDAHKYKFIFCISCPKSITRLWITIIFAHMWYQSFRNSIYDWFYIKFRLE